MKFECVLMDLDGSTLNRDGTMPGELEGVIRAHPGTHWVLVTGRGYASASRLPHATVVDRRIPHVFDGGTTVMSLSRKSVLQASTIQPELLRSVIASLDLDKARFVYASTGIKGTGLCWYLEEIVEPPVVAHRFTKHIPEFQRWLDLDSISKLTVSTDTNLEHVPGLTFHRNGSVVDVTPVGVDKGSSARTVFEFLGVTPEKSIFVFNDKNDLPVLDNPFFARIQRLKVGPALPNVPADFAVPTPADVPLVLRAHTFAAAIARTGEAGGLLRVAARAVSSETGA